jgi:hypothetical protein
MLAFQRLLEVFTQQVDLPPTPLNTIYRTLLALAMLSSSILIKGMSNNAALRPTWRIGGARSECYCLSVFYDYTLILSYTNLPSLPNSRNADLPYFVLTIVGL